MQESVVIKIELEELYQSKIEDSIKVCETKPFVTIKIMSFATCDEL